MNDEAVQVVENQALTQKGIYRKYEIKRRDGKPVKADGGYFVLKLNGSNERHRNASLIAAKAYADAIQSYNPNLARELNDQILAISLKVLTTLEDDS